MKHDDEALPLALLANCLTFMPVGLYYRIRSYTGEKIDRWQEGTFILFGLRLTALVVVAAGLAWMINPQWLAPVVVVASGLASLDRGFRGRQRRLSLRVRGQ